MPPYDVRVIIANKRAISDPEGETILRDLVLRDPDSGVSAVRAARMLTFTVDAPDADAAAERVRSLCDSLRIYNPLVSAVDIAASEARLQG